MLLRPHYRGKAEGCCLCLGLMAKSSPLLSPFARGLLGALWLQEEDPWWERGMEGPEHLTQLRLCLPGLPSRRGKRYPVLILARYQPAFPRREEFPGSRQEEAAAGPPHYGDCGPTAWTTQAVPLCFTSITSNSASLVSLSWFLKGFLSTWQGHSSLFLQEIWPKMLRMQVSNGLSSSGQFLSFPVT